MGKQALSLKEINKIKKLRLSGCSIDEIFQLTKKGRGTIYKYIKDVTLSEDQVLNLRSRQGGSKKKKEIHIKLAEEQAEFLLSGPYREDVIILAMLYWAEGHKNHGFGFTNTDGRMIKVFIKILVDVLNVPRSRIRPILRIFTGMNEMESLKYWSKVLKIPMSKIKVRMNDGGKNGRTKYGMCLINISKGHSFLKLMHAIIDNIVKTY